MKIIFKSSFLILLLLSLYSCNVQKRVYNKGFSIQNRNLELFPLKTKPIVKEIKKAQIHKLESKENIGKSKEALSFKIEGKLQIDSFKDSIQPCDKIILITGEIIEAYLIEINEQEIKYVKCNNPQGPFYFRSITNLHKIIYPNGTSDYFNRLNQNVKIENVLDLPLTPEELEKKKAEEQRINNRKRNIFTIIVLFLPLFLAAIFYLFNI